MNELLYPPAEHIKTNRQPNSKLTTLLSNNQDFKIWGNPYSRTQLTKPNYPTNLIIGDNFRNSLTHSDLT